MVDKSINIALEQIVQNNKGLFDEDKRNKIERLESKLNSLINERSNLSPSEVANLRNEAATLDKVANFAEQIADKLEKDKQDNLQKKKIDEVKAALMQSLGIPPEFVDQLSILTKAGPEALREAAGVYRDKAKQIREDANFLTIQIQTVDSEIKKLNEIKTLMTVSNGINKTAMNEYLAQARYQEAIRDKADEVLREVLASIEGEAGSEN